MGITGTAQSIASTCVHTRIMVGPCCSSFISMCSVFCIAYSHTAISTSMVFLHAQNVSLSVWCTARICISSMYTNTILELIVYPYSTLLLRLLSLKTCLVAAAYKRRTSLRNISRYCIFGRDSYLGRSYNIYIYIYIFKHLWYQYRR